MGQVWTCQKQIEELVAIEEACLDVRIGRQVISNTAKSPEKSGQELSQLGESSGVEDESIEDHGGEVREKAGEVN